MKLTPQEEDELKKFIQKQVVEASNAGAYSIAEGVLAQINEGRPLAQIKYGLEQVVEYTKDKIGDKTAEMVSKTIAEKTAQTAANATAKDEPVAEKKVGFTFG